MFPRQGLGADCRPYIPVILDLRTGGALGSLSTSNGRSMDRIQGLWWAGKSGEAR
jgi:hypothetical protein